MWSPAGALQTAAPQRLQSSAHLFSTWCEMWMKLAAQRVRVFPKSQVSFLEVLDLPALLHRFRAHVCVILSSLHSFVFSCTQRHLINNVLFTRRIRFSPNHFFSCFNQQYYISTSTPFSSFSLYPVQLSSSSLASSHLSWGLRLQHLISISVSGQPGGFERGGFVKPNACVFVCFLIHLSLCLLCLHMCVGIHTCVWIFIPSSSLFSPLLLCVCSLFLQNHLHSLLLPSLGGVCNYKLLSIFLSHTTALWRELGWCHYIQ